jgi:hypothetical protein
MPINDQYDNNLHIQSPGKFNQASSTNPITYQRFLNCDVKGFNLNLGFGGAETTMTMDLVESLVGNPPAHKANETLATFRDRCNTNPPDSDCNQLRYSGELGRVYTFIATNVDDDEVFEFSGILSDHDIKIDSNGRTITIRLTDGRVALENVQLVIGNNYSRNYTYNSAGESVNVLNILYETEKGVSHSFDNLGFDLPTDPSNPLATYSKCDYFMDSGYDDDGIPVTYVLGQFMSSDRYMSLPLSDQTIRINLDNIYNTALNRVSYMRINDTSISLMDLLQQVCEEAAGELVINTESTATGYEIVASFIDRSVPIPSDGYALGAYVQSKFPVYKSLSYGQESSYETTQNLVFGSKMRYFVEVQRQKMHSIPTKDAGAIINNPLDVVVPDMSSDATADHDKVKSQDLSEPPEESCYDPDDFTPPNGTFCNIPTGGGRIAMVLGEKLNGALTDQGIPAYTLYLSNLCGDYMGITYDLTEICSILGVADQGSALLTEEELLFSQTYESYINWATMHPNSIGSKMGAVIFGDLWGNFQEYSLKIFADIVENGSFDSFKDPALAFPDVEVSKKLFEVVHAYVKNIYDTYYGKEYVALLDTRTNQTLPKNNFQVCIGKSFNTWTNQSQGDIAFPQANANVTIPNNDPLLFIQQGVLQNVIKTAGKGYLSTSETVCNGAWFGGTSSSERGATKILSDELGNGGLGTEDGLARFLNDDNTIGSFVKYGPVDSICKRIGGTTFVFRVDLSALNPSDFVVRTEIVGTKPTAMLYLRASVSEEMYFGKISLTNSIDVYTGLGELQDDYTWVRFSIPRVKLIPTVGQEGAVGRAASRMALIALQVMTDMGSLSGIIEGDFTLRDAIADKLAGGGINPGVFDGIAANLAVTNLAKMSIPAIVPEAVAIPLQSEIRTYGPWKGVSNPSGGMNVVEMDLAPWQFGFGPNAPADSYNRLEAIGSSHAQNGTFGRLYQEKASISLAGIPEINIGVPASQLNQDGTTTGDPYNLLTDISFGFGADGARTTMTYQTYSPKFGNAPKYLEDTAKNTIGQKLEYMKQFRTERIKNAAAGLKLKEDLTKVLVGRNIGGGGGGAGVENSQDNSSYGHTPTKFLMCGYLNKNKTNDLVNSDDGRDDDSPTIITHNFTDSCEEIDENPFGYTDTGASTNEGNVCNRYTSAEIHPSYHFDSYQKEYYKNLSMMSMDGIYLPISIEGGPNNNLARYTSYSTPAGLPKGRPITMMPPVNIISSAGGGAALDLVIDQKYTNPICSKAILSTWDDRNCDSDQGFVIMNVAHGSGADDNFNFDTVGQSGTSGPLKDRQQETDFRFTAMRGPLVLQAWGYDINGKPIPNANDSATAAESGTFRNNNLEDKFLKNWLSNPKTWPAGPIDLRWDRHRGMWVSPPSSKIIVGRLTSSLSAFGSATAELLNPSAGGVDFYEDYDFHGADGTTLTANVRNLNVTVHDYIGSSISKCAIVLLYYADGKYMVIEEGGSRSLQRARISSDQTLSCNGQCQAELFSVGVGGGITYGDIGGITVSDTMGIVSQTLAGLTRVWVYKPSDAANYEVVYIGTRTDADCGSCGGFGVYQVAGVDFNRLPTVASVGKVVTVTDGGCLALVDTKSCDGTA